MLSFHQTYDILRPVIMSSLFSANHIHICEEEIVSPCAPMDIVRFMAEKLATLEGLPVDELMQSVMEREADEPTAIGRELAIPHARLKGISHSSMMMAKSSHDVQWGDRPVRLIVLTVVPEECPDIYLQIMSSLIRWRMQWKNESWEKFSIPFLYSSVVSALPTK